MGKKRSRQTKQGKIHPQCPSNLEELKKFWEVDSFPGSKKNQEELLEWVKEESKKRRNLEWLRKNKDYQLAMLADTEKDSEEDLDNIARKARFEGFIQPLNLARILAAEEDCKDILPKLWKKFDCNFSGREVQTDTPNRLKAAWWKLIRRITGLASVREVDPILGRLPAMLNYLNLYNHDPATGELKLKKIKDRTDADFIKLEDLPQYFKKIQEIFEIKLPLPKRLFPVTPEAVGSASFKHSEDFRSVSYSGKKYILTSPQAQVVEILHEAWEKGTPDVGRDYILVEKLDRPSSRLRDIFKSNPSAWKDLIRSDRKGTVRLNIS